MVYKIIQTEDTPFTDVFSLKPSIYTFLNPVSYLDALKHKNLFASFDGIFADGSILVSAIRLLYGKKVVRRSFDMTSLAPQLFEYAVEHHRTVYIVASKQEEVEKAVKVFLSRYAGLQVVKYRNGYFIDEAEMDREVETIMEVNPDFVIVGMGIVAQETFLLKVKQAGFQGIGFTCGGFIHQTAMDKIDYYPEWIDRMNLRFLYRIVMEKHTRKRYLKAAFLFPVRFIGERIFG